jgi:hypothetical protein
LRAVVLVLWIAYLALIAIRVVPELPLPGSITARSIIKSSRKADDGELRRTKEFSGRPIGIWVEHNLSYRFT